MATSLVWARQDQRRRGASGLGNAYPRTTGAQAICTPRTKLKARSRHTHRTAATLYALGVLINRNRPLRASGCAASAAWLCGCLHPTSYVAARVCACATCPHVERTLPDWFAGLSGSQSRRSTDPIPLRSIWAPVRTPQGSCRWCPPATDPNPHPLAAGRQVRVLAPRPASIIDRWCPAATTRVSPSSASHRRYLNGRDSNRHGLPASPCQSIYPSLSL